MSADKTSDLTSKATVLHHTLHQDVPTNENPLSEREMEVARLLATGASNSEIAHSLIISPHTVKVHLRNIFDKLQVNSRTEASMMLVQRGWLAVPGVEIATVTQPVLPVAESTTTSVPIVPADPQPLPLLPYRLPLWQRLYLIMAALLALVALLFPTFRRPVTASPNLLSDAGQPGMRPVEVQALPLWQSLIELPEPRSRHAQVYFNDQVYVFGGETTGGKLLDRVDVFDLRQRVWQPGIALPVAVSNSSATVVSNTIYLAGGTTLLTDTNQVAIMHELWQWQPGKRQWELLIELPTPLAGAGLLGDGQSLYLIGGWDGQQMHDEVWRLTVQSPPAAPPVWQLLTRLETACAFAGVALHAGHIYVMGGSDGQHSLDLNYAFDLTTNQWQTLPPMPSPRSGFSLVSDGRTLLALGGDGDVQMPVHDKFDTTLGEWTNSPLPVQGRWNHPAAVGINGWVYITGGWSGDYLSHAFEYQSSYRLMLPVITKAK